MATVSPVSGRSLVIVGIVVVIPVGTDAAIARAGVVSLLVAELLSAGAATTVGKACAVTNSVRGVTTVAGTMFVRGTSRVVTASVDVSTRASVSDWVIVLTARPVLLHEVD